jgi:Restriction endonuclease
MTGREYEQFVRAVLSRKLNIPPDTLRSTHSPGVTLPNAGGIEHQIDLFYVDETEVAEYVTIIECKYRGSRPVDQILVQNLAFVRTNTRAHKAILVSNQGFTDGAYKVAESQTIALLTIKPTSEYVSARGDSDVDMMFRAIQSEIDRIPRSYEVIVVHKLHDDGTGSRNLVADLLADPRIREKAAELLRDPNVQETAQRIAADNPDLARRAMDFLRKRPF